MNSSPINIYNHSKITKKTKSKKKHGKIAWLFIILLILIASLTLIQQYFRPLKKKDTLNGQSGLTYKCKAKHPLKEAKYKIIKYKIKKNDTISNIFNSQGISNSDLNSILKITEDLHDITVIKPKEYFEFYFNKKTGNVQKIKHEINKNQRLIISKTENAWLAKLTDIKFDIQYILKESKINSSLYNTGIDLGLSAKTIVKLAEIFAWDIDFATEIQSGDYFKIYYELKKRKDCDLQIQGKILAALFINKGKKHFAFYYKDPDNIEGYYNRKGKSLKKQFLRSPLSYKYISSGYSKKRFHPILKRYIPHESIDYAAPTGTPVVSIGDGTVVQKGWNNGWGLTVTIKHNSIYTTRYGHFSKIPKNIKYGSIVKQGQIIGYVGQTGYATGPHLDFTFFKYGYPINHYNEKFPSCSPVQKKYMDKYNKAKKEYLQKLNMKNIKNKMQKNL
jgi:murein DD-endopeptidase MepM/ murein hydrolase activator NlpD